MIKATSPLTALEQCKLENLIIVVQNGKKVFLEVGRALSEIRDENLWAPSHATFAEFAREQFGFDRSYASRLIKASKTAAALPIGTLTPKTESVLRELARIKDETERNELWGLLCQQAAPDAPTTKMVRLAVDNRVLIPGLPTNPRHLAEIEKLPANRRKECWRQIESLTTGDDGQKLTIKLVRETVAEWMQESKAPAPGEGMSFDSDATEEVEAEDKGPRLPPISRPIEENPAETADRIARSTVYTMNRDWRLVPIAFRERFYDSVVAAVAVFERELYPDGDSEADDA